MAPAMVIIEFARGLCLQSRWRYQGTTLGKVIWDRQAPASQATYLDPLGLLVHGLHVIVELGDVSEASKILLLLGQEVLSELVQVPILRQLQQPQMRHLIALKTLALPLLAMLLGFNSCSWMGKRETPEGKKRAAGSLSAILSRGGSEFAGTWDPYEK